MKVDKLFPRWRAPFEGPRLLALAETCGGGRNRARPERARQFERLAERQLPLWLSPSRGVWNPYEAPVSIGSRAIQPHLTDHGTGIHVSSKPSKTRGSVRFSRTAEIHLVEKTSDRIGRDGNIDLLENLGDLLGRLPGPLQPGNGISGGVVLQKDLDGIDYFGRFFSTGLRPAPALRARSTSTS